MIPLGNLVGLMSLDDSYGIYAYIYVIHIFSEGGWTGQLEVVQEVIADLKSTICVWCLMQFGFAVFRKEIWWDFSQYESGGGLRFLAGVFSRLSFGGEK